MREVPLEEAVSYARGTPVQQVKETRAGGGRRNAEARRRAHSTLQRQREFFIDNLLVRIHFIIVMIRWTGLAPWKCEFPFPRSLTSTFLAHSALQLET